MIYSQLDHQEQTALKFEKKNQENAFKNVVCKILATLFRPQLGLVNAFIEYHISEQNIK